MKLTVEDFMVMGVRKDMVTPYLPYINFYFGKYDIVSENEVKYSFANILHETGDFKYMTEIGGGSDNYEGGKKHCGRGLPHLTHIRNYRGFQTWLIDKEGIKLDLITSPEIVASDPKIAALAFIYFWTENPFRKLAEDNNFMAICALWNTGKTDTPSYKINGWNDRVKKLEIVEKWIQAKMNSLTMDDLI